MDHTAAVKKYVPGADDKTIGAIVKHLGIALRNRDSSLVSCSDPNELKTVRESWCKKKLGLSGDAELDAAIKSVCETMKADHDKSRVAFYYLVAEKLGKLSVLA
ncbi:MAG: DUF2853 family protein [Rhodoblastus sp.]|nr:DUF2853 family protein [Rhodoblastus sp.]